MKKYLYVFLILIVKFSSAQNQSISIFETALTHAIDNYNLPDSILYIELRDYLKSSNERPTKIKDKKLVYITYFNVDSILKAHHNKLELISLQKIKMIDNTTVLCFYLYNASRKKHDSISYQSKFSFDICLAFNCVTNNYEVVPKKNRSN